MKSSDEILRLLREYEKLSDTVLEAKEGKVRQFKYVAVELIMEVLLDIREQLKQLGWKK